MQALIHGYFDGTLTENQEAELNAWVKAAPQNAAAFAEAARLHDHLHDVVRAGLAPSDERSDFWTPASPPRRLWRRVGLAGAVAALVALAFLTLWGGGPASVNAATELNRLIEEASKAPDRSYIIHNLDAQPEVPEERRPPIDGAILCVRPPDQYVLIRKFPDGRPFVTGSDGERSWSVPPSGAVRVSADPLRFRGPVPGHQQGIPFANLRSDLVQLRDAYVVATLGTDAAGRRGLLAEKKSTAYRGPNRIELWYDTRTGVIERMVFDGMPQARGGPNRVAVELLEQRDLGADYFRHESHHGPDRRVIEED